MTLQKLISTVVSGIIFLFFLSFAVPQMAVAQSECQLAAALIKNNPDSLIELKEAFEKCPQMIEARYNYALSLYKKGDFEAALQILEERALEDSPHLILLRARTLLSLERHEESEVLYKSILTENESSEEALLGLALILQKQGKLERALEFINRAMALQPDSALIRYNLATLYEQLGRNDDAILLYQEAASRDEKLIAAWQGIARLSKSNEEKLSALRSAYINAPKSNSQVGIALATSLLESKEYDEAGQIIRSLPNRDEWSVVEIESLVLLETHQEEKVVKLLRPWVGKEAVANIFLAWAYSRLGRLDEARDLAEKTVDENPQNAFALALYGEILTQLGASSEARLQFEKARELNPEVMADPKNWWDNLIESII